MNKCFQDEKSTRDFFRYYKIENPKVCFVGMLLYLPPIPFLYTALLTDSYCVLISQYPL